MVIHLKVILRRSGMLARGAGVLAAALALVPHPVLASPSDDALLKMLEGEAQKVGTGTSMDMESSEQEGEKQEVPEAGNGELPKGLSQEQFSDELKKSYPASHTLYIKLVANARAEIYRDYQDGAGIEKIRAKISERTMHR